MLKEVDGFILLLSKRVQDMNGRELELMLFWIGYQELGYVIDHNIESDIYSVYK